MTEPMPESGTDLPVDTETAETSAQAADAAGEAEDGSGVKVGDDVTVASFEPGQQVKDTIDWSGTTSSPGCATPRQPVAPGAYQAVAKIGEKPSAPITFNVNRPSAQ